jgi:hypothetical protein
MYQMLKHLTLIGLSLGIISIPPKAWRHEKSEPETVTITLQPGPAEGQDCLVVYREHDKGLYANANHNLQKEFGAARWTYYSEDAGEGTTKAYLNFTKLSSLPVGTVIKSAKLSLYGISSSIPQPQGNSWYNGSPYAQYGSNSCWIKRVTGKWDQKTIKWVNKPGTTEEHKVSLPPSSVKWNYDAVNIDVTNLVKDMVAKKQVYGFCIELQSEKIFRSLSFGSCERTDNILRRPKLVLVCVSK